MNGELERKEVVEYRGGDAGSDESSDELKANERKGRSGDCCRRWVKRLTRTPMKFKRPITLGINRGVVLSSV